MQDVSLLISLFLCLCCTYKSNGNLERSLCELSLPSVRQQTEHRTLSATLPFSLNETPFQLLDIVNTGLRLNMNGSESFGSGERFYYSLCPVSLSKDCPVTCPQCKMVRYRSVYRSSYQSLLR